MTWRPAGRITNAPLALGAAFGEGTWVVRDLAAAAAARAGGPALLWRHELDPAAGRIGPKLAAVAAGTAVTVEDFGSRGPARVVAFGVEKGEPRWSAELPLRLGTFGLAALEDAFVVQGGEPGAEGIVHILGAADGESRATVRLADGNGVRVVGGKVYAPTQRGLFEVDPGGGEARQLSPVAARGLYVGRGGLFLHEYDPSGGSAPAIVWTGPEGGAERGRFAGSEAVRSSTLLVPLSRPGRVLVVAPEASEIVDVGEGRVAATLEVPPGGMALSAWLTPHGLVALCEDASFAQSVLLFDEDTGRATGSLPVQGHMIQGSLFHEDGHLLASGEDLEFFAWGEP